MNCSEDFHGLNNKLTGHVVVLQFSSHLLNLVIISEPVLNWIILTFSSFKDSQNDNTHSWQLNHSILIETGCSFI